MLLDDSTVAIACGQAAYPEQPPYSPHKAGPEYPFGTATLSDQPNPAYAGVREALHLLELDADHYGTAAWNPLRGIAEPGDTVVLKPNFVREFRETHADHGNCLFTHGAILRAVLDYAFLAIEGSGRIVIADAPQNDADFDAIVRLTGLRELQAFYRRHADFNVEVYDLRPERARKIDGVIVGHDTLPGDPAGYVKVNLGAGSAFSEINHLCHLLYGSEYNTSELVSHHRDDMHEYLIAKTILDADCVISLPKLKTHKKVGLTVNMKNLVGINGNKNWLPHHRQGTPSQGGDQFADDALMHRAERTVVACFKRVFPMLGPARPAVAAPIKALGRRIFGDTNTDTIRSSNWFGNDTTWRMVLDLNRILFYADSAGVLHDEPVRRLFSIVDGIIAGEGNGPLDATPKSVGLVVAGANPVAVDLACARVMGFDRSKLPVLRRAFCDHAQPLAAFDIDSVTVRSNDTRFAGGLQHDEGPMFAFRPHFGWLGHVELGRRPDIREMFNRDRQESRKSHEPLFEVRRRGWGTRLLARATCHLIVGTFRCITGFFGRVRGVSTRPAGHQKAARVMLTGTFLSDNWVDAHVRPLAMSSRCQHVWVVSDRPMVPLTNVTYVCPPALLQRVIGRVVARSVMVILAALVHRPHVIGGFHLLCNGMLALAVARMVGARAMWFCVGGGTEFVRGGARGENRIFTRIGQDDMGLEHGLVQLIRQFDLILTMGTGAKHLLLSHGVACPIEVMPGGLDTQLYRPARRPPKRDLVTVVRLAGVKRIDILLQVVHKVAQSVPTVTAAIVGEGEGKASLIQQARQLGLSGRVHFVGYHSNVRDWLAESRLFVLTSDSEGLSLALMEAMMAGLPAVVSDVGDLGDLVHNGENGWRPPPRDVDAFAQRIVDLLTNEDRYRRFSAAARQAAMALSVEAMAARWDHHLARLNPEVGERRDEALPLRGGALRRSRRNLWALSQKFTQHRAARGLSRISPKTWLGRKFGGTLACIERSQRWSADEAADYQLRQVRRILTIAYERSPYYRQVFRRIGFEPGDLRSLGDVAHLPTIDADAVRANLASMCTVLRRPSADFVSTGGTGGKPLHFYINTDRSIREYAHLVASWRRVGYALGHPMAVLRGRLVDEDANGRRYAYDPFLHHHYYSVFHMTEDNMRWCLAHIAQLGPCYLHVYPSSVNALARFIRRSGCAAPTNVAGIIAESEIVYPDQRAMIEEVFNTRLLACYGQSEKVVLAAECEHSTDYHIWPTYGYFELLDEQGQPVTTPGQRGEIVGTGFINTIMPFIRYRTGDTAIYVADHCDACGRKHTLIRDISGHRTQEVLITRDQREIPWTALNMHDDTFLHVRQFQFYQDTPGKTTLRIVPTPAFANADRERIIRHLGAKLDGQVDVTIECVDSIALTPRGKTVYVEQRTGRHA